MRSLLLIRHAEVDNDGGRRYIGRTDVPLTSHGEGQARALAARLCSGAAGFAGALYTSPLARARQTAAPLAQAGLPSPRGVRVVDDLREIDFGDWEGRLADEVGRGRLLDPGFAFPGGESVAAAAARAAHALESLWPQEDGATSVAVAHGGIILFGLCAALGLPLSAAAALRLDFAGVTRLERHRDRIVLGCLNDTSHLSFEAEAGAAAARTA